MRKLLILPFVLVAVIYAAWPGWSAWQLRAAVKARDLAGIESRVDWPTLRSNFKQSIGAYLRRRARTPMPESSPLQAHAWAARCRPDRRDRCDAEHTGVCVGRECSPPAKSSAMCRPMPR